MYVIGKSTPPASNLYPHLEPLGARLETWDYDSHGDHAAQLYLLPTLYSLVVAATAVGFLLRTAYCYSLLVAGASAGAPPARSSSIATLPRRSASSRLERASKPARLPPSASPSAVCRARSATCRASSLSDASARRKSEDDMSKWPAARCT